MKYIIKEEQIQAVLNYLVTQPYNEVFKLIDLIRQVDKVEEGEEKEVNEKKSKK